MYNLPVLTNILQSSGRVRLFYALLLAIGIFFTGSTIFTALTTVRFFATMNPFPTGILLFSIIYIAIQALLAFHAMTCRRALAYMLTIHASIILLVGTVVLPMLDLADLQQSTLLGSIPFVLMAALTLLFRNHLTSNHDLRATVLYTLLVCASAGLSVTMYL